jgi:alkylation response protein AidB-like acyl-CoA dehydrogenase
MAIVSGLAAVETLPEGDLALRRAVRGFLRSEIENGGFTPDVDSWLSGIDPAFSSRLAQKGWVGMTIPRQFGGGGHSDLERFIVAEELLAAGAPVAAHWIAERQVAPAIVRHGSEEQRQRYLPAIARADSLFALGMSEPDAGSDLASIRTRAIATARGWQLRGMKIWTSSAHVATSLVVLARTDDGGDRHAGLSQFLLDLPDPRIEIRPIRSMDGRHHFNEVVFDDVALPKGSILGTRGSGWRQVTEELATERSGPERIYTTLPLLRAWAAHPDVLKDREARTAVGAMVARLSVLRQMSLGVAQKLACGLDPSIEAAMVKDLGTTFEAALVEDIRRLTREEPDPADDGISGLLARAIQRSPGFTLRGGTNEILRSIVAKELKA